MNYKIVMSELKKRIRRMKVSYSRLAKLLDVPESTLKKWFNASDGSFNRITMICEALGLPLEVVLKSIQDQKVQTILMRKEQQSLFLSNRNAFDAFWLLVYERKQVPEVMKQLNLSSQVMKSILLKLDKVGLIQLGVNDEVKVPRLRPVQWEFKGPFLEGLREEWSKGVLKDSLRESKDARHELQFFQLSEDSSDEFFKELRALEDKFARRTILELGADGRKLKQIRYLSLTAVGSFI